MPIAMRDDGETRRLDEEPFRDEAELQTCLERSPFLVLSESEPPVETVQREVELPSAGILDLLVVDKDGLPIAVEVKLARNTQSRREVVAPALDYISDLSELTFDELDDRVHGSLTSTLQKLVHSENVSAVRRQCAANLRAGRIRLVIAVDSAPAELIRMVRDLWDRRNTDVRLVAIRKYAEGRILVPRMLVEGTPEVSVRGRRVGGANDPDSAFVAVVNAYDRMSEEEWKTRGHRRDFRKIGPDELPEGAHYEFVNYASKVGIEFHLESDEARGLAPRLSPLSGSELVPGISVEWDPRWSHNRGRLVAKVGKDQSPEVGARAMQELIARTRDIVHNYLKV